MIATHDTYTYCKPKWFIMRLFSHYWKCQGKNTENQYKSGARYFDIRVKFVKNRWVLAHGLVVLDEDICFFLLMLLKTKLGKYPYSKFRIVLESGSAEVEDRFIQITQYLFKVMPESLDSFIIKKGWKVLLPSSYNIIDYTFKDWSIKNIIKGLFVNVIKQNSKEHLITQSMIEDKNNVYFVDYL